MPLPIDHIEPERERPSREGPVERMCPICSVVSTLRVCDRCGIDVVTRDLVRTPAAPSIMHPEVLPVRRRRRHLPPRTLPDLLRAVVGESQRGVVGTILSMLWALPLWALGLRPVLAYLCAYVLAERARGALGSAVVLRDPDSYAPEEDSDSEGDARQPGPLGAYDVLVAALKGGVMTLLSGPVVVWFLTPARISALEKAGFLGLAGTFLGARVLVLGTVFVTATVIALALRLSPGRRTLQLGHGSRPFDVLEVPVSAAKACVLMFFLLGLAVHPLALLIGIPLLPLVAGALASGWEDLHPGQLLHALRTTPRYWVVAAASAAPMAGLAHLLAADDVGGEIVIPGVIVTSSLLGILAGIARQDCESEQFVRDEDEEDSSTAD